MTDLVLSLHRAPGDTVVLTGLFRDLQRTYPGQFRIWADVEQPTLLRQNPYLHEAGRWPQRVWPADYLRLPLSYGEGIIRQKYEPVHFLSWFHRDFTARTGLPVPVTHPTPDLHLTPDEEEPPLSGRYWVIVAGGKTDATVKIWSRQQWQATVDGLRQRGLHVVQLGARRSGHIHFPLTGTLDLVGQTTLRDVLRLIRHAEGVICGITFSMHVAAALNRPCVVIAGGREAWWWEAYVSQNKGFGPVAGPVPVPHKYLHTIGLLPCGEGKHGCWRNQVAATDSSRRSCYHPVAVADQLIPRCLELITAEHVLDAVMEYYEDQTLPPIRPKVRLEPVTVIRSLEGLVGSTAPSALPPPAPATEPIPDPAWDDPILGGKLTIFVLLYGNYPDLHRQCLDALILSTPRDRVEIRVLSNQLCTETGRYVNALQATRTVAYHYARPDNPGKYPAMRAAFFDPERPIRTNYLLWLDDDTICDRDPYWLRRLLDLIQREHPQGARMFGPAAHIALQPGQLDWIRAGAWYRGRPLRDKHGRETPQGNRIHFVTGSFWALHVPTLRECDIPDPRLVHNGGDVMIGEQLHQLGHSFRAFSNGKTLVRWSAAPRRGRSERPAGTLNS